MCGCMGIACDSVADGGGGGAPTPPLGVAVNACPACGCGTDVGGGGGNVIDNVTVCGAATVEACVDGGVTVA